MTVMRQMRQLMPSAEATARADPSATHRAGYGHGGRAAVCTRALLGSALARDRRPPAVRDCSKRDAPSAGPSRRGDATRVRRTSRVPSPPAGFRIHASRRQNATKSVLLTADQTFGYRRCLRRNVSNEDGAGQRIRLWMRGRRGPARCCRVGDVHHHTGRTLIGKRRQDP